MNILYIILKRVIWRFQIYNLFREIFKFREDKSNNVVREIRKCFRKTAKFEKLIMAPKKLPNLTIFCFYMICLSSLFSELRVIEVCVFTLILYVVGKKCQPQYKNNGKTKFLEA